MNIANLLLRFVIFAAIFFLGLRMARGFSADDALRLITGPVGIAVAAAASAVVVVVFLMMDTAGSSAGLVAVFAKDARNAALVEYYGAAGRLYPAFITVALFPAMLRTLRSGLPALVRSSAGLLAVGTVAICLSLLSPVDPSVPRVHAVHLQLLGGPVPGPGTVRDLAGQDACEAGAEEACWHDLTIWG